MNGLLSLDLIRLITFFVFRRNRWAPSGDNSKSALLVHAEDNGTGRQDTVTLHCINDLLRHALQLKMTTKRKRHVITMRCSPFRRSFCTPHRRNIYNHHCRRRRTIVRIANTSTSLWANRSMVWNNSNIRLLLSSICRECRYSRNRYSFLKMTTKRKRHVSSTLLQAGVNHLIG